jgi:hypothetical protein
MKPYKFPNFQKAPKQCVIDLISYLSNLSFELEIESKTLSMGFNAGETLPELKDRAFLVYEGMREITTRIDTLITYLEEL